MHHHRSIISLCKLLSRHPFHRYSIPTSPIRLKFLSSECTSNSVLPSNPKNHTHHYLHTTTLHPNRLTGLRIFQNLRKYSVDTDKLVDEINLKFGEAREEIEMALESKETVYFDEEAECARAAVKEVLDMFDGLLAKLPESEKAALQRSMGLKIEQLKAELNQLNE